MDFVGQSVQLEELSISGAVLKPKNAGCLLNLMYQGCLPEPTYKLRHVLARRVLGSYRMLI